MVNIDIRCTWFSAHENLADPKLVPKSWHDMHVFQGKAL